MKTIISIAVLVALGVMGYLILNKGEEVKSEGSEDVSMNYSDEDSFVPDQTAVEEEPIINTTEVNNIMKATLHTNKGNITIEFDSRTPKTAENFITLAKSGFYDGTKFHRVIQGFMSQGGDPLSKDDTMMSSWGTGGPGYKFADEIHPGNSNDAGTISMANAGPDTNGSQFFINAAANHGLDTKHTVFGKVIDGLDIAEKINSVPTDERDRPLEAVVLEKITLE
jgi:cyclophilin family peptidyl-prolyl cis-trans isomerase